VGKSNLITYLSSAVDRDINRVRQYLARYYGTRTENLTSIRLTGDDFLINIPNELSPRDIVNDSHDWAPRQDIMVDKFEGEPKWRRPTTFGVMVHLKNILLKLWSRETASKILEEFREPAFIDDATTIGSDRCTIYAMVDYHDGQMIPLLVLVHAEGIWEEVFVIVVDLASIDGAPDLVEDYLYGRTEHNVFGIEDSARKSLARGSQRLWDFYRNQIEWGDSNKANSDEGDQ
jgi:hypothetical protein